LKNVLIIPVKHWMWPFNADGSNKEYDKEEGEESEVEEE
jgi:hypothetical protein